MAGKKAIFFDIDGTLIAEELVPFKDDCEAMEEAARKGHFLFLNTGRSFANVPPALLALPSITGVAAGGGAHILMADSAGGSGGGRAYRTVYRQSIPGEALEEVTAWYLKYSRRCLLEGERDCYIIGASQFPAIRPLIPISSPEDFKRKSRGDFITKLTMQPPDTEEERLFLETRFKINPFPNYAEAIIKGENKAKAMELILKRLGLRREDSVAIGDGANDMDMIRYAGLGVAMGNARPELKAAAGAIVGDCGKGGVAEALRKYALRPAD